MNTPELLTVEEIARFLKVSPQTVYYWVRRKEMPSIRIGKHLRFEPEKVLAHFQNQRALACRTPSSRLHSTANWSLKTSGERCSDLGKGTSNGNH